MSHIEFPVFLMEDVRLASALSPFWQRATGPALHCLALTCLTLPLPLPWHHLLRMRAAEGRWHLPAPPVSSPQRYLEDTWWPNTAAWKTPPPRVGHNMQGALRRGALRLAHVCHVGARITEAQVKMSLRKDSMLALPSPSRDHTMLMIRAY